MENQEYEDRDLSMSSPDRLSPLPPLSPSRSPMLFKSTSWDNRTVSSAASFGSRSEFNPPFALDDDNRSTCSRSSADSRGYRHGGPKQARLKRVAFLSSEKDVSGTYPVKLAHLPPMVSPSKLKETFNQFGDVADVYIPTDPQRRVPVADFAIVRFGSEEAACQALASPKGSLLQGLAVSPLSKQKSFFSNGTGYHGISNEPVDDGTYVRHQEPPPQDISLESCMSRAGYPWGSFRELKFLPPHISPEARDSYAIRIEGLDHAVDAHEIEAYFSKYGPVASVNCPKPLIIAQRVNDPNCGSAFVRFFDRRDADCALADLKEGKVVIRGKALEGKFILPPYWPSQASRRYY